MPDPSYPSVGVALLGAGVVGGGVVRIITEQREMLRRRTGLSFDLRHIVVRDPEKLRAAGVKLPESARVSTAAAAAIDDPNTQVVVELVGGTGAAGEYVERALRLGKPVVTANKSLLSARGAELFALARKHGACIGFEASCGGGIPIIAALTKGLAANRVDALVGIVNGTCNFILTQMTRHRWSYADALREAQKAGFAEADPTLDVSGRDAAQKLGLLASLAFNVGVDDADVHVEGIDTLQPADIDFAASLGYVIKLLAIAERGPSPLAREDAPDDGLSAASPPGAIHNAPPADSPVSLRVHPTLVHKEDLLAEVSGSFNAISVYGHALGHALFYGRGAGAMPTASAVVSDLVGIGLGSAGLEFKQMRIFPDATPPARVLPFEQLQSRYYLRLMAMDRPGVLAQVTRALGDAGISLAAIHQHENNEGQFVPVVITTHLANEGAMQAALKEIDALPAIVPPTVRLRIIDRPREFSGEG